MMIYQPLEIKRDGKGTGLFHMTARSDEGGATHPVGYCADCPGHATAKEAEAHYREWQADHARAGDNPDEMLKCVVCDSWTTHRIVLPGIAGILTLCVEHSSRDHVIRALERGAH